MAKTRVSVFLDGANFFYMQKDRLHWWIDPNKLLDFIHKEFDGELVDANYYLGVPPEIDEKTQNYHSALTHMGYTLSTKTLRPVNDQGTERYKANLDVDIVHDMLVSIDNYDIAVLVSGDIDFEKILMTLKSRGKRFIIMSTQGFAAREILRLAGNSFIDFNTIREEVEKENQKQSA